MISQNTRKCDFTEKSKISGLMNLYHQKSVISARIQYKIGSDDPHHLLKQLQKFHLEAVIIFDAVWPPKLLSLIFIRNQIAMPSIIFLWCDVRDEPTDLETAYFVIWELKA